MCYITDGQFTLLCINIKVNVNQTKIVIFQIMFYIVVNVKTNTCTQVHIMLP